MAENTILNINSYMDGDKQEFNCLNVPFELMLPLSNYLKLEFVKRSSDLTARSFREERALQQQRYAEKMKLDGLETKQIFLDFPTS